MIRKRIAEAVLLVALTGLVVAPENLANAALENEAQAKADLLISEFVFPADSDKTVRVHVVNTGGAASTLCILRLTVRKINGLPVGNVVEIKLPLLAPGEDKWLGINAASILPKNVSLESTTFKLNADATSIVMESNEANNEVWHKL